jgi:glycosyltransferase involved in cell wall biosynthesis
MCRLVVMIPAFNEELTVAKANRGIPASIPGISSTAALVINDGSTDGAAEAARQAGATVVHRGCRQGVGAAFRTGIAKSLEMGADIIASIDADGQFDPGTLPALIAPVVVGDADFATASRFADPSLVPQMPWIKRWGNRCMSRLVSRLIGQRFYDVSCGMRRYNRHAAMCLFGDMLNRHRIHLEELLYRSRSSRPMGFCGRTSRSTWCRRWKCWSTWMSQARRWRSFSGSAGDGSSYRFRTSHSGAP